MNSPTLVPAAQYLRMSTEHQRLSLENQMAALRLYTEKNNFDVVKTHVDSGKSGLVLKHRDGLAQLLHDVVHVGAEEMTRTGFHPDFVYAIRLFKTP